MKKENTRIKWIKVVLANDESASDTELVAYFMQEGGLTKKQAEMWVARREQYLNTI